MAKHPLKVRSERTRKGKLKRKVIRAYEKGRRVLVKVKPSKEEKVKPPKPKQDTTPRFSPSEGGVSIYGA